MRRIAPSTSPAELQYRAAAARETAKTARRCGLFMEAAQADRRASAYRARAKALTGKDKLMEMQEAFPWSWRQDTALNWR